MPSFKIGMAINAIIGAKFPGGHLGWAQAGCDAVAIPVPSGKDVVYILLSEEGTRELELEAFRDRVEQLSKTCSFDVRWVSTVNFEGMDMSQVKRAAEQSVVTMPAAINGVLVRPSVLVVSVQEASEEQAEAILDSLEGVGGIRRAVLVSPLLFKERTYSTPSIQAEAGTRPVSKSDVADVASLVESVDNIDDFIERM